jgi:hypothetical protein
LKLCRGQGKAVMHKLAQDTLYACDCHWRNQGQGPWVAKSELEAVNCKLDNLAGLVASLVKGMSQPGDFGPPLAVVPGGAS